MSGRTNTFFIFGAIIICGIAAILLWKWVDKEREVIFDPTVGAIIENNQMHYYPPSMEPDEE
ncbi:MAG: hypothetical protein VW802_15530 [Rhodospirillaceae bacterium]|jgi:hypothetical protein